jgi:predicted amidophosphoribosyltransferase
MRGAPREGAGVPLISELVALVAPPCCPACRRALPGAAALRLCPDCAAALPWLPRRCCPRCALPSHRGRRCPATRAAFDRAWAPLAYEGVARDLVAALKFRAAVPLADLMAAQIAAGLPTALRSVEAVVPVPAHRGRRRRRGFDPAGLLAAALAPRLGLPLAPCLRRGGGRRQVGAGRAERRDPSRLAVRAVGVVPSHALLVDDVHTTGATLDACARALRAAGCRAAVAVSYARTL